MTLIEQYIVTRTLVILSNQYQYIFLRLEYPETIIGNTLRNPTY